MLPPPSSARSIVLVANRRAGRAAALRRRMYRAIEREGLTILDTLEVEHLERLRHWLALPAAERPLVVAAGGDGTVGTVTGALANSETVLGILPLGTSNDLARSLGIPMRIEDAVRLLTTGKVTPVDIGQLQTGDYPPRYFLHAAAVGLNVAFARLATRRSLRKRLGRLTYLLAAAATLRAWHPFACTLHLPGRSVSLTLLHFSVINAPVFGGYLRLHLSGSTLSDSQLDVLAVENIPLLRLALAGLSLLLRRPPRVGGVHLFHTANVRLELREPLAVSLDGEIVGCVPGTFSLVPSGLRVIAPQAFGGAAD